MNNGYIFLFEFMFRKKYTNQMYLLYKHMSK